MASSGQVCGLCIMCKKCLHIVNAQEIWIPLSFSKRYKYTEYTHEVSFSLSFLMGCVFVYLRRSREKKNLMVEKVSWKMWYFEGRIVRFREVREESGELEKHEPNLSNVSWSNSCEKRELTWEGGKGHSWMKLIKPTFLER